jgi:hypothetical protein
MTRAAKRDLLIVTCAVSAGIHAALVPEHLAESAAAGSGFIAATVLLAAAAVALTVSSDLRPAAAGTGLLLIVLLVSYALVVWRGVPVLHPETEPIDALAVVTKAIEALGLGLASTFLRRPRLAPLLSLRQREGVQA